jgi:hypothetical protein
VNRCAAICATVLTLGACQTAQNGGEALTGAPRAQKTASQPQPETPRSAGSVPAYSRDAFGTGWTDPDHNGCDARQDAIRAATTNRTTTGPCKITRADIRDRYTGRTYPHANPSAFDIDHVVALHDAWNVRTYRAIKLRWRLHTTPAQRAAIRRTLATCTGTENR